MSAWRFKRYLIINADDFGQSHGLNRGLIEAHERGIVTSASLMVRWPAAREAAAYARRHPEFSVGLHFDFAEWTCEKGKWRPLYEVVPQDDVPAVVEEANRQLAAFRRLLSQDPTHLDSHQHAHRKHPLRPFFEQLAGELGVPLRCCDPRVRYVGGFYGQSTSGKPLPELISAHALMKILRELRPGFTEVGCHPGYAIDLQSMYRNERSKEVETLSDPRVRSAIDKMRIRLCSFHNLSRRRESSAGPKDRIARRGN